MVFSKLIAVTILVCLGLRSSSSADLGEGSFVFKIPKLDAQARDDLIATAVSVQNCCRAKHGVSPLNLDPMISAVSQAWANTIAQTDHFAHSGNRKYGENLFAASPILTSGATAIYNWYIEIKNYNFQSGNDPNLAAGHFTQVVWANSMSLGIGIASSQRWTYVVANYFPPGNVIGQYSQNVFPPLSGDVISACFPPDFNPTEFDEDHIQVL